MGDQPEDLYTNATGESEPTSWRDTTPPASPLVDAPPAYSSDYSSPYQPADGRASHEEPAPTYESDAGVSYSATDSYSGWASASKEEPPAAATAVLDDPWRPPLVPSGGTAQPRRMALPEQAQRPILAEPFPRSWALWIAAGVALALAAAFLVQALLVRGDWAESALVVGYTAVGLAAFALVIAGVRFALGRRAVVFYALAGLLLIILLATGGGSLALAHQLHLIQAQTFENAGQWEQAAKEYALYGERAPHAPNLGRVYLRWGQVLARQQAWSDAANHLSAALAANPSDADLTAQTAAALYTTFAGWLRADASHVPFPAAVEAFTTRRGAASCDVTCKSESTALEAQARYLYGQELSAAQRYADAATQFSTIETQLVGSAYVGQAHAAAATSYLALGQLQVASKTCADAVPTYQTLTKSYGDTPEGQQAAAALAAPQKVTGTFTSLPTGNPIPRARLSKFANPAAFIFSSEYTTAVDGATGAFTFTGVKQGAYNLAATRDLGYKTEFHYYHSTAGDLYSVKVGPLCTLDLGSITY
jgi:tetratricopeptide (TPR) repeat protein